MVNVFTNSEMGAWFPTGRVQECGAEVLGLIPTLIVMFPLARHFHFPLALTEKLFM